MASFTFDKVDFRYRKNDPLFEGLSFEVDFPDDRQFVLGIMGGSGTGKSTILKLILGINKPHEGTVRFSYENQLVGYVPQEPVLFEHLSIMENARYFSRIPGMKQSFSEPLFNELATALGISDMLKEKRNVLELSGGQRQRLSLLRALALKPRVLLLDEPLTGLDEEIKDAFLRSLTIILERFKLFVIYVSHHPKELEYISNVILYLNKKKYRESTGYVPVFPTQDFFSSPPNTQALHAVKMADTNLVPCNVENDGDIKLTEQGKVPERFLAVQPDTVHLNMVSGFEFVKVSETATFVLLRLLASDTIITLRSSVFYVFDSERGRLLLEGKALLYDTLGTLISSVKINQNRIIS